MTSKARFALSFLTLLGAADLNAREAEKDRPPDIVSVTSPYGEEHLTASCNEKNAHLVACDFTGIRFIPADLEKAQQTEEELRKALATAKPDDLRKQAPGPLDAKAKDRIASRIADLKTGPKTKHFLRQFAEVTESQDVAKSLSLIWDHQKRTCSVFVQHFSLDFKRIGPGKWLSNPGPGGLCNVMKVYELNRHPDVSVWTLSETIVTVGDTSSYFCKGIEAELHQVTVWSWENPDEYELPCDFMSYHLP